MRLLRISLVSCLLSLSACAFNQIEDGLSALRGQEIQTAFDYLGYPDNQQKIAGNNVYTWGRSFSTTTMTPVTNYGSGTITGYGGYASYTEQSTSYVPQTNNYSCTLKLITDESDVIINGQYEGNLGGCANYGTALANAAKALTPPENPDDALVIDEAQHKAYKMGVGKTVSWQNEKTGNNGNIAVFREGTANSGALCKEFQNEFNANGNWYQTFTSACQQPDGSWEIVN